MATITTRENRNPFWHDRDGVRSVLKDPDEVETFTVDWTRRLNSGETIATTEIEGVDTVTGSSWEADGVTIDSSSATTTTATATISGTAGEVKNTVVTSGGRTIVEVFRIYAGPGFDSGDYD